MNRTLKPSSTLIAVIGVALLATTAYATQATANDSLFDTKPKVTLIQAVTVAEAHVSGSATRAEYERTKSGLVYDIEVVSDKKVFDVRVDADKGTIISSALDSNDKDDHDGKD